MKRIDNITNSAWQTDLELPLRIRMEPVFDNHLAYPLYRFIYDAAMRLYRRKDQLLHTDWIEQ